MFVPSPWLFNAAVKQGYTYPFHDVVTLNQSVSHKLVFRAKAGFGGYIKSVYKFNECHHLL